MTTMKHAGRLALGAFFMLHGFAHSPAILGAWKIKTFEDVSYRPNFLMEDATNTAVYLLGVIWLIAAAAFLYAGYEVIRGAAGWIHVATFASVVSLSVSILWYQDAIIGLVIDIAILAALAGWYAWSSWTAHHHHPTNLSMPSHA